jgi:hypothetical protein
MFWLRANKSYPFYNFTKPDSENPIGFLYFRVTYEPTITPNHQTVGGR